MLIALENASPGICISLKERAEWGRRPQLVLAAAVRQVTFGRMMIVTSHLTLHILVGILKYI